MKKLTLAAILWLLSIVTGVATAGPNSLIITQRNSADTGNILRTLENPTTTDGILVWRKSTQMPAYITIGSGFSLNAGVLSVAAGTGTQGPAGPAGSQGVAGADGKSAYQLAVDTGYSGSVTAWLASLKGADGQPGPPGKDGTSIAGPAGPQGPAGASITGPQGPAGASVTGPAGPAGANGKSAYELAQVSGYTGALQAWLTSLQGAAGRDGTNGTNGKDGATGPTGATGATGAQGPAGTPAPTFNFGLPVARTLAVSTAYQASTSTKPAIITVSPVCTAALTLSGGGTCTLQARIGAAGLTCSTGTVVATWTNGNTGALTIGLALNQIIGSPYGINLPTGAYFVLCPTAGTFTITAAEQTAG